MCPGVAVSVSEAPSSGSVFGFEIDTMLTCASDSVCTTLGLGALTEALGGDICGGTGGVAGTCTSDGIAGRSASITASRMLSAWMVLAVSVSCCVAIDSVRVLDAFELLE